MYTIVKTQGDLGRTFEAWCEQAGAEPAAVINGMIEGFINAKAMQPPPQKDMGEGLDKFTSTYLKMRDTKQALVRAAEKECAGIQAQMDKIEAHLLSKLNTEGVDSMKTKSATFYKEKDIKPSCGSWPEFYAWVRENDAFEFLERRITKTAVVAYMEEHGGLPPGVNILSEFKVRVRRGKDS